MSEITVPGSKAGPPPRDYWIESLTLAIRLAILLRKCVVLLLGVSVVGVGVVMLVAPGPAFLVIPAGLAILATEFFWAKRLLIWSRDRIASRLKSTEVPTPANPERGSGGPQVSPPI